MTSKELDELFERLKASANPEGSYAVGEYGHSYKLLTHKDAENIIGYLKQYSEIKKIVDEFDAMHDSSPMVEWAYAESTKIEKVECFDQILNIFSEVD